MHSNSTSRDKRGSIAILGLFLVLFGGGIFVYYGVAHGRPIMKDSEANQRARNEMVERQIAGRDVTNERVLEAMRTVPRHVFVPLQDRSRAYDDRPLPIGHKQTISQPYIVAAMAQLADLTKDERVLEIGSGSGYGAAVLSRLAKSVDTIEIIEPLGEGAKSTIAALGYSNITVHIGDGYRGLPSKAPFDAIVVTAAPSEVPPALVEQLAIGGRLVIPVGKDHQRLEVYVKTEKGVERHFVFDVSFVPMTGEAQKRASR